MKFAPAKVKVSSVTNGNIFATDSEWIAADEATLAATNESGQYLYTAVVADNNNNTFTGELFTIEFTLADGVESADFTIVTNYPDGGFVNADEQIVKVTPVKDIKASLAKVTTTTTTTTTEAPTSTTTEATTTTEAPTSTTTEATTTTTKSEGLPGDFNEDGEVSVVDIRMLALAIATENFDGVSEQGMINGDVSYDGLHSVVDIRKIAFALANDDLDSLKNTNE